MPALQPAAFKPKVHGEPVRYLQTLEESFNLLKGGTQAEAVRSLAAYWNWRKHHDNFDISTVEPFEGTPLTNSDLVAEHYAELLAQELEGDDEDFEDDDE